MVKAQKLGFPWHVGQIVADRFHEFILRVLISYILHSEKLEIFYSTNTEISKVLLNWINYDTQIGLKMVHVHSSPC